MAGHRTRCMRPGARSAAQAVPASEKGHALLAPHSASSGVLRRKADAAAPAEPTTEGATLQHTQMLQNSDIWSATATLSEYEPDSVHLGSPRMQAKLFMRAFAQNGGSAGSIPPVQGFIGQNVLAGSFDSEAHVLSGFNSERGCLETQLSQDVGLGFGLELRTLYLHKNLDGLSLQVLKLWQVESSRAKDKEAQLVRSHAAARAQRQLRTLLRGWRESVGLLRQEATAAARQEELFARVTDWLETSGRKQTIT